MSFKIKQIRIFFIQYDSLVSHNARIINGIFYFFSLSFTYILIHDLNIPVYLCSRVCYTVDGDRELQGED